MNNMRLGRGSVAGDRHSVISSGIKTPLARHSSVARRSSSYAASSRQSLAPIGSSLGASGSGSAVNNPLNDPRQIRSPAYQKQCRDQLADFLLAGRCHLPLTAKTLISPTTKEFQSIFKWLVTSPDALGYAYHHLEVGAKGFEQECVQVLRDLKYPADVGKTALGAPGSPTNWPTILVMLVWLADLARALSQWSNPLTSMDPLVRPLSTLSPQEMLESQETSSGDMIARLEKEYFSEAYAAWWSQDDDDEAENGGGPNTNPDDAANRMLVDRFQTIEAADMKNLGHLTRLKEQADKELNTLAHQPDPLIEAEQKHASLVKHTQDQQKYIDTYREKAKKHQQAIEQGKAALINVQAEIQQLVQDKADLERQVAEQNLSPEQVVKMTSDRSSLSESIRELIAELGQRKKQVGEQEIAVTRRMDDIDSLVQSYAHARAVIGHIAPTTEGGLTPEDIDFDIHVNMASSDLTAVNLVGTRIKESIRPALNSFGTSLRSEWHTLSTTRIELDDSLDRLASELEQRRHHVQTLELKLSGLETAAQTERERVHEQAHETRQRVAQLEREVGGMSAGGEQELVVVESEVQQLIFAYVVFVVLQVCDYLTHTLFTHHSRQEMIHQATALREKIQQQVTFHLEQIINAKEYATDKLNELTLFAKECA